MNADPEHTERLKEWYYQIKPDIEKKIEDFRGVRKRRDPVEILKELFFCILTPQSKAYTCWDAVEEMTCNDLLLNGDRDDVLEVVGIVRFKYRKTAYILEARGKFCSQGRIDLIQRLDKFDDARELREWLVNEIKGYGYKEASHFLRNIGLGENMAILDRHILKNLVRSGVINEIPSSITRKRYIDIEKKMRSFSREIGIPMAHLDLLFWYLETKSIFK